jgi:hypothetical protein
VSKRITEIESKEPGRTNRLRHTAPGDLPSVRRQRATQTHLVKRNTSWSLVDSPRAIGDPSVAMIEIDGSLVVRKDPQRNLRETQDAQPVDRSAVQLYADAASPVIGP